MICLQVAEVPGDLELRLQLTERASCRRQELHELLLRKSPFAFGNITGDRNSRASNLVGQAIYLAVRKRLRGSINVRHEHHGILPDKKISKRIGHSAPLRAASFISTLLHQP